MIEFKWEVRGCKVERSIDAFLLVRNLKKFHWTFKPRNLKILWLRLYIPVGMVWSCTEEWSIGISRILPNVILFLESHCLPVLVSSSILITHMCFTNQKFDTILGYNTVSGKKFGINKIINWKFPLSGYDDAPYLTRTETSATQQREPKNLQDFKPIKTTLSFSFYG
jgi:hypothetical protein